MKILYLFFIGLTCFSSFALSEKVNSITQFGITWTFDTPYESGRFANGDYWVVGPVKVVAIDPPSVTADAEAQGGYIGAHGSKDKAGDKILWTKNGSMLNPSPTTGNKQGYDSTVGRTPSMAKPLYDPALNVAVGVCPEKPLVLQPDSSLVSTISRNKPFNRPQPDVGAVLTILKAPATAGSFRPPYSGTDKSIRFNKSQLNWNALLKLEPAGPVPEIGTVSIWFEKPWLDHVTTFIGGDSHPIQNLPDYGRDMVARVSVASLILQLDLPKEKKEELLIRFVQTGIDLHGVYQLGKGREGPGNPASPGGPNDTTKVWSVGGGTFNGRKWPIVFAGIMLGDKVMQNVKMETMCNEDGQTYYGDCWTGAKVCWGMYHSLNPKYDHEGKTPSLWTCDGRGKPGDPGSGSDSDCRSESYRNCCNSMQWVGEALAVRLMGATKVWNHDAFFDYVDRWMTEDNTEFRKTEKQVVGKEYSAQQTSRNKFVDEMWAKYRPTLGPADGWKKPH